MKIAPTTRSSLLLLLFFGSGMSGLIYEVVWMRMLIRVFGVTVYAVSTVLVVFLGGLALGSVTAGRKLKSRSDLLKVYGAVEIMVAVFALLSTRLMLELPGLYARVHPLIGGSEAAVVAFRFVLSIAVLVLPTFLMGATLPVLSGYLARAKEGAAKEIGRLYGANTFGAVVGTLASGFVLLYLAGEQATALVAVALNAAAGSIALLLARSEVLPPAPAVPDPLDQPLSPTGTRAILWLYAASGFSALTYQVVWSRILNLVIGNSVYGFSLMLAVYLLGIAAGSVLMARFLDRIQRPLLAFGILEALAAVLALLSLDVFIEVGLASASAHTYSQLSALSDFLRIGLNSLMIVLPVTLVLGAMFPLVARLCSGGGRPAAQMIGELYAYNTLGAIVGSFLSGFVFLDLFGTLKSFLAAAALSFAIGAYLVRRSGFAERLENHRTVNLLLGFVFVAALGFSLRDPFYTVLRARIPESLPTLAHEEDKSATVTLFGGEEEKSRHLFINGIHVSDTTRHVHEAMIDLPLSFHPDPKRAMLVGFGVGDAFKGAIEDGLDTTIVELLPSVIDLFRRFAERGPTYLTDPRAHLTINDARNHLLVSAERFDFMFVDVTPPLFASGMVNLYSKEFFALVRAHLGENGIFALWFPTRCFEGDFWMIERNFSDTFESVSIWGTPEVAGLLMLGSLGAHAFDAPADILDARLSRIDRKDRVLTGARIKAGQILSEDQLRARATAYPPVTDDHPYTEFPLFDFVRGRPYYGGRELFDHLSASAANR